MHLDHQGKYRKVYISCRGCGKTVRNKRTGREREFCSDACRKWCERTSEKRTSPPGPLGYVASVNPENTPEKSTLFLGFGPGRALLSCMGCGRSLDAERVKLGGRARFCADRCVDAYDAGGPVYGGRR
jgi:endogenous inhibitor of DNA gyrase (YacG/DUF329 family)